MLFFTVIHLATLAFCIFLVTPRLGTTGSRQVQFDGLDFGKCNKYISRPYKKRSKKTDPENLIFENGQNK